MCFDIISFSCYVSYVIVLTQIDSLIISSSEDDDYLITERMKYANDEINRSLNRVRNSNDTEPRTLSDVLSTHERD